MNVGTSPSSARPVHPRTRARDRPRVCYITREYAFVTILLYVYMSHACDTIIFIWMCVVYT